MGKGVGSMVKNQLFGFSSAIQLGTFENFKGLGLDDLNDSKNLWIPILNLEWGAIYFVFGIGFGFFCVFVY